MRPKYEPSALDMGYGSPEKTLGPKPSRVGDSLTGWDIKHKDKFRTSFSHIPKERWKEIFGNGTHK